ncbi:NUMOD3 domain-containing DNA-binding protein [Azospirillum sp.]|uniref:NUMOD3 domain-containing DNA-binding protein n=1 Tax=Azospirillum sp. TaxID=34012 RepID=UPI003D71FEFB
MAENTLPLFEGAGKFYVYIYRDPRPGKRGVPIYVGKGSQAYGRADDHWGGKATNRMLRGILAKVRSAGLEPIIEIVAWFDDEAAAFCLERSLIAKFGRRDLGSGTLCNMTSGGEGAAGAVRSKETKAKIGAGNRGKTIPRDVVERIAAQLRGRKLSEEHRRKLSIAHTGRKIPPDVAEKAAATHRGKKRPPETGRKISEIKRGKPWSEARRAAHEASKAKPPSAAQRAAWEARKGMIVSGETRAKQSIAQRKRFADAAQ